MTFSAAFATLSIMTTKQPRIRAVYLEALHAARETVRVLLGAGTHTKHQAILDAVAIHDVSYRELDLLVQAGVQV